jgi:hypothetical protein
MDAVRYIHPPGAKLEKHRGGKRLCIYNQPLEQKCQAAHIEMVAVAVFQYPIPNQKQL